MSHTGKVTVSPNGKPHKKKKSKPVYTLAMHQALEGTTRNFNLMVKPPMTSKGHHVRTAASSSNN